MLRRLGVEATVRPSLAFYNTRDEVDRLVSVVRRLSLSGPEPSSVSSATATIGPEASWTATSDFGFGWVIPPLKRRRHTVASGSRFNRSDRAVSLT